MSFPGEKFERSSTFLDQPHELILEQLALLPVEDAIKLCQSNTELARLCENRNLWYRWAQRDFPYVTLPPLSQVEDSRNLYHELLDDERARRRGIFNMTNMTKYNKYWRVSDGGELHLRNSVQYVTRTYPGRQGYDKFVYWPDYNVAGTVNDIFRKFHESGMKTVQIGELDYLTEGELGDVPGEYPLSVELILANSFDPLNPVDQMYIQGLFV